MADPRLYQALCRTLNDKVELARTIEITFAKADVSKDGSLTYDELVPCVRNILVKFGIPDSHDSTYQQIFRKFDVNGDGRFSYGEFYVLMQKLLMQIRDNYQPPQIKLDKRAFICSQRGRLEDHYVLGKVVGQGSFGTVRIVTHKDTKHQRACKALSKHNLDFDRSSVEHEISMLKSLDHPYILPLYEFYEDRDYIYLITEALPGGELFERISKFYESGKPFTEADAAHYMKQMLLAINYCHEKGIVHRDLKPENALFASRDPDSPLKLIDLGLAQAFERGKLYREVAGTPLYMAPEMFRGNWDSKVDIWSLGVILYQMLSGDMPFIGQDLYQVQNAILAGFKGFPHNSMWNHRSSACKDLISKMLTFDPRQRPNAAHCLNHPWIVNETARNATPLDPAVVNALRSFSATNKLKQAALLMVASNLSSDQLTRLRKQFAALDKDGNGTISVAEMRAALAQSGQPVTALDSIIDSIDADKSGQISYTEFIAATLQSQVGLKREYANFVFNQLDKSGDGRISKEEIMQALLGTDHVSPAMRAEITALINMCDKNHDGLIDREEFFEMLKH